MLSGERSHTLLLERQLGLIWSELKKVRFALDSTYGDTLLAALRRRQESTRYAAEEARPSPARARAYTYNPPGLRLFCETTQ